MGVFYQGAESFKYFARGQIAEGISPEGRYMGAFHQGADSLEHLARGQIARDISPGGRKMGAEASKHLARGADR